MISFKNLFFIFFFYSVVGWVMEVINSFVTEHKFVNRGFLIGPYCPIYGFGCAAITFFLSGTESDIISLFLKSILICSVLEYFTGYLMEKIFKYRWWDYSNRKFNINGRICLETTIPFGIGACLIIKVINPMLLKLFDVVNPTVSFIILVLLLIAILVDNFFSIFLISKISGIQKDTKMDSTEELKKQMFNIMKKGKKFYRRIFNSFPSLKRLK